MKTEHLLHPSFLQPEDLDVRVWRYISLSKLIDMLLTNSLYLSRIDCLQDLHEGTYTKLNNKLLRRNPLENNTGESSEQKWRVRQTIYVNCWRLDQFESVAMWRVYCPNSEGVAIQTTYRQLLYSLPDDNDLHIGCVQYLDYENDSFETNYIYSAVMHKRIAFNFENEVRIVKKIWSSQADFEETSELKGIKLSTTVLDNLECIYVNPESSEWYFQTIRLLVAKLGSNLQVKWSGLKANPYM